MRRFLSFIAVTSVLVACSVQEDTQVPDTMSEQMASASSVMSSVAPAAVTQEMLQTYLPGKTFLSRATSGMWGVFRSNGMIDVFSGRNYDPTRSPDEKIKGQPVSWQLSEDALLMKFSEQTTLDWSYEDMKFIEQNGQTILSLDKTCVNIIGNSAATEGRSPDDLDAEIQAGSCQ